MNILVLETKSGYRIKGPCGHEHEFPKEKHPRFGPQGGWTFNGSVENPTFSPSMNESWGIDGGFKGRCHFVVANGKINYCNDCTHIYSGVQGLDLIPWSDDEVKMAAFNLQQ